MAFDSSILQKFHSEAISDKNWPWMRGFKIDGYAVVIQNSAWSPV